MSKQLSTEALNALCNEYLDMLEAAELPLSEQKQAGACLRDRIRTLLNTCQAGFEGKLESGKWVLGDEEFDTYEAMKQSER